MKRLVRTWPYGTQLRATVLRAEEAGVLVVVDELGEAHVLVGTRSDPGQEGDKGILTFMEGGPNGGYWRFAREALK